MRPLNKKQQGRGEPVPTSFIHELFRKEVKNKKLIF